MIDFSELYDALEKLPERLEKALMGYGETSAQKLRTLAVKKPPLDRPDRAGKAAAPR